MACNQDRIISYLLGELSGEALEAFHGHVSDCAECQKHLALYEKSHNVLKNRDPLPIPKGLDKACIRSLDQHGQRKQRIPFIKKILPETILQPSPVWRVATVAAVFFLGFAVGKMLYDRPSWTEKYGRFAESYDASNRVDNNGTLRNYLLSVETLLLDLSNMEMATFVDEEEWDAELSITQEVLRRTREMRAVMQKRNPELHQLMSEIEWVLEDIIGMEGWELAESPKDFRRTIDEKRLLMKIHGFIS